MARFLIADGDESVSRVLGDVLWKEGHAVMYATTAQQALAIANDRRPEVAVVDVDLVGSEGLLDAIRRSCGASVLVLLAVEGQAARVPHGTRTLAKPFSLDTFRTTVREILAGGASRRGGVIDVGVLRVDVDGGDVTVAGRDVDLTPLELELLLFLYDRRGTPQTREALLHHVWGIQGQVETRTVDTHVKRLRQKLGAEADVVETVRGVGYRFVPPPKA